MATRTGICLLALLAAGAATAGETSRVEAPRDGIGLAEAVRDEAMKTLGGRLLWGDVLHFRGWRVQQNSLTKHHRLLDPADRRHASGELEHCVARLEEIKRELGLAPLTGKVAVLLHGMGRSGKCWPRLSARLESAGYQVVCFDYPSTRCSITESADYLARVIEGLEGAGRIDFVCHSMGGLVVRAYLAEHRDPRIGRMVMLGVPNRGAEMADRVAAWPLYKVICGPGGCELVTDPEGLIASLPTPDFEFAVIAGGRGKPAGYNPLIPGDDDGTVTVASTRLPGAADFLLVDGAMHSFLMYDPRVVAAAARFLETGRLREAGEQEPIPTEPADAGSTEPASPAAVRRGAGA